MNEFTPDEIEGIVKAMSQKKPTEHEKEKIPLRPPGSYKQISKVSFSPLFADLPRPLEKLTEQEGASFGELKIHIEVFFAKTTLTLKELASLEVGSLLPLHELCDDLVDIYANGRHMGRGEVVTIDGHYGVRLVSFIKD